MSPRLKRVRRLRELADRQERASRFTMAQSAINLRREEDARVESLRRTRTALAADITVGLRGAMIGASVTSSLRHDEATQAAQIQMDTHTAAWHEERTRAESIGRLFDRIRTDEQVAADRMAEIELGDVVAGRTAVRIIENGERMGDQ